MVNGNGISRGTYLKAGIATFLLFAVSLSIGYWLETQEYSQLESRISALNDQSETSFLMMFFLSSAQNTSSMCGVLRAELNESEAEAYSLYLALESEGGASVIRNYEELRRSYFLANTRYYLLLRQYIDTCDDPLPQPILFFYYTNLECPECIAQGKVLDQVRYECPNTYVFAFPADADLKMVDVFTTYYGVEGAPSLVLGETAYNGLTTKEEIKAKIGCG